MAQECRAIAYKSLDPIKQETIFYTDLCVQAHPQAHAHTHTVVLF